MAVNAQAIAVPKDGRGGPPPGKQHVDNERAREQEIQRQKQAVNISYCSNVFDILLF